MIGRPSADRPWLVADIGGTNARFGLVTEPGGAPHRVTGLRCRDHDDLAGAAEAYLAGTTDVPRPVAACVAVAGPVSGDRFRLTNAHWDFSVRESTRRLRLSHLELINDFAALAMAVPRLADSDRVSIGGRARQEGMPVAVIGPGTGLGVAAFVPGPGGGLPVPGEGGHVSLPAESALEHEIAKVLRARRIPLTAESVLSGPGLVRLYECLSAILGTAADRVTPEDVCGRARQGSDTACVTAVLTFCALLGSFAGNAALTFGARGGVVLGGGILPSVVELLARSDFRRRFAQKPPMNTYLAGIATDVVTAPTPALLGATAWLDRHCASQKNGRAA